MQSNQNNIVDLKSKLSKKSEVTAKFPYNVRAKRTETLQGPRERNT